MCGDEALSTDKSFNVIKETLKFIDFPRKFSIFSCHDFGSELE